ncbi:MAG: hypothetical protein K9N07_09945 [Candidatus Cloacimonetes bacterium]|nr:hypothetical protein [Candidatus Cloacimonadota bacterium]
MNKIIKIINHSYKLSIKKSTYSNGKIDKILYSPLTIYLLNIIFFFNFNESTLKAIKSGIILNPLNMPAYYDIIIWRNNFRFILVNLTLLMLFNLFRNMEQVLYNPSMFLGDFLSFLFVKDINKYARVKYHTRKIAVKVESSRNMIIFYVLTLLLILIDFNSIAEAMIYKDNIEVLNRAINIYLIVSIISLTLIYPRYWYKIVKSIKEKAKSTNILFSKYHYLDNFFFAIKIIIGFTLLLRVFFPLIMTIYNHAVDTSIDMYLSVTNYSEVRDILLEDIERNGFSETGIFHLYQVEDIGKSLDIIFKGNSKLDFKVAVEIFMNKLLILLSIYLFYSIIVPVIISILLRKNKEELVRIIRDIIYLNIILLLIVLYFQYVFYLNIYQTNIGKAILFMINVFYSIYRSNNIN